MSSVAEAAEEPLVACPTGVPAEPIEAGGAPRVFYGYTMVPLAMLILAATTPGQTFGVSFFNEYFRAVCGLSSTGIASVYLVATVLASLALPYLGGVADRIGLRRAVLGTVAAMALVCLFGSTVSNTVMLFVLFLLLRMLGPGYLSLLANNTLANWFDRRLGVASGVMQFGMAVSFGLVPTVVVLLIGWFGWRGAYVALAAILASLFPLLFWLYREHPRDVGEVQDGRRAREARQRKTGVEHTPEADRAYTLADARSTRAFWLLLVATGTWTAIGTGLVFHAVPLFGEFGFGPRDASLALSLLAAGMGVMQVTGGMLADRIPGRWMVVFATSLIAASCALIAACGPARSAACLCALRFCARGDDPNGVHGLGTLLRAQAPGQDPRHLAHRRHRRQQHRAARDGREHRLPGRLHPLAVDHGGGGRRSGRCMPLGQRPRPPGGSRPAAAQVVLRPARGYHGGFVGAVSH